MSKRKVPESPSPRAARVIQLLVAWSHGGRAALDALTPMSLPAINLTFFNSVL